jgi:hypothetical protein
VKKRRARGEDECYVGPIRAVGSQIHNWLRVGRAVTLSQGLFHRLTDLLIFNLRDRLFLLYTVNALSVHLNNQCTLTSSFFSFLFAADLAPGRKSGDAQPRSVSSFHRLFDF